ncbi:MAG: NAD(P)/FAD-dependent oxidoreductase [Reyranellaceae bacterium]
MKIAVIGAGVAGLGAAWLAARRHDVVLYEKEARLGGHSNTVVARAYGREIPVDTGFIVYNERNYPELTSLFAHLGVATQPSDMSFAVSLFDGGFEFGSGNLAVFGQGSNVLDPRFRSMLADLLRFNRAGRRLRGEAALASLTLGDWLQRQGYGDWFADRFILPLAASIWSSSLDEIRGFPLLKFAEFFDEHRLFNIWRQQKWRTVGGGSRTYVDRLAQPFRARARLSHAAVRIERHADHVAVRDASGAWDRFDEVVLACHADQALALLAQPSEAEHAALSAFRYAPNRTVLHTDASLMPRRRRVWSSWNYVADRVDRHGPIAVTYWMNRLQNIDRACPLFVTNNPRRQPAEESVLAEFEYSHPLFDHRAFSAQPALADLQGVRRTWFCGSYFGFGFHEGALASGLDVAEALGGHRPWRPAPAGVAPLRPLIDTLPGLGGGGALPGHGPVRGRADDA